MAYYSALKEWNSDTCSNMEEPWKQYAKYKKPDTEEYMLYDFIEIKLKKKAYQGLKFRYDYFCGE